jgi:hypothetical protein
MLFRLALLTFAVALVIGLLAKTTERVWMARLALIGLCLLLLAMFVRVIRI